jgi:hypothetical protein
MSNNPPRTLPPLPTYAPSNPSIRPGPKPTYPEAPRQHPMPVPTRKGDEPYQPNKTTAWPTKST